MKKISKSQGMAIGIAMFLPIGFMLATTTGNPGLIGVGIPIGMAVGMGFSKDQEPR